MYFYVTRDIKIGNKVYIPCVQYKLTKELEATVQGLAKQNKAIILNEVVMFYNGALVYPKKPESVKKSAVVKKSKKGKK